MLMYTCSYQTRQKDDFLKTSTGEVVRTFFYRLTLLFSRTREVEQQMISNQQPRNTDDQPMNIQPGDALPDMNVALDWVRRANAKERAEKLAKEMNADNTSPQAMR